MPSDKHQKEFILTPIPEAKDTLSRLDNNSKTDQSSKFLSIGVTLQSKAGFSIIELLVVIAIIGILASVIFVATGNARVKGRDAKRKTDLAQIGQMLYSGSCYAPNAGAGNYDLADLIPELKAKYPQYAKYSFLLPKDPKTGSDSKTNYRYLFSADGHCVFYANFENTEEVITLPSISSPTPGIGGGFFKSSVAGPNGTNIYYQIGK